MPNHTQLKWHDNTWICNYMQQINRITQLFPEISLLCYFEESWTYMGMSDQIQKISQDLQELINYILWFTCTWSLFRSIRIYISLNFLFFFFSVHLSVFCVVSLFLFENLMWCDLQRLPTILSNCLYKMCCMILFSQN